MQALARSLSARTAVASLRPLVRAASGSAASGAAAPAAAHLATKRPDCERTGPVRRTHSLARPVGEPADSPASRARASTRPPAHPADLLNFSTHSSARHFFHYTSYAMLAGVPLALAIGDPVSGPVNLVCGVVIPLHAHIGMRSVLLDYVHDVPTQRVWLAGLAAFTVGSAAGLTWFNVYDVGLTEGLKALWIKQHA